jgi:hypothetical protein
MIDRQNRIPVTRHRNGAVDGAHVASGVGRLFTHLVSLLETPVTGWFFPDFFVSLKIGEELLF